MGVNIPPSFLTEIVPYMAWNRLEGRPRKKNFENVLKAEVRDPLWMIGRQWQMGEFTGNDTGTGIYARMQMDYTMINGVSEGGTGTIQPYQQELPLEPLIESIFHKWSLKERVLLGRKFFMILARNVNSTAAFNNYRSGFLQIADYVVQVVPPTENDTEAEILERSKVFSNQKLSRFLTGLTLNENTLDGGALFMDLYGLAANAAYSLLAGKIPALATHQASVTNAVTEFSDWVKQMYTLPESPDKEAWDRQSMNYNFEATWPKDASSPAQWKLPVKDYHHGHFDWYSFVQELDTAESTNPAYVKQLQLIMNQIGFKGMPSTRWWEFEDGSVNFCQIDGNTYDLAQIIMTQFALVYQDDWFMVPITVPVGSYSKVRGIVVTDVFGVKTFVAHHSRTSYSPDNGFAGDNSWKQWRFLDIGMDKYKDPFTHTEMNVVHGSEPAGKLLLPPVCPKMLESKPIETVLFLRDEMSNMAWAIETIVPDDMGKGIDGTVAARSYTDYLKFIKPPVPAGTSTPDPDAVLKYQLASTEVPENWIPFIAAKYPGSDRDIRLQRAAMPRFINSYDPALVRPRTGILRYGLDQATTERYYINEEEITRAGAQVTTTHQRTRWYNGKIVHWVGRRKQTGKGEGSSGLLFDKTTDIT